MEQLNFQQLHALYDDLLRNNIIPWWFKHGIDRECGGLFNCFGDDGSIISTHKYLWSQCRAIWTFAADYNRFENRAEFLDVSRATSDFVLKHGRDEKGWYVWKVSRGGETLEGPISVYTDFFAAYGFGELYRATKEQHYLDEALRSFRTVVKRTQALDFDGFAPYTRPEGIKWVHGIPMIALEVAQELAEIAPETDILAHIDWCLDRVMNHHRRPELKLHLEYLGPNNEVVDSPPGRCANSGHAIESMWFVIHQARRRKDTKLMQQAFEVIRWMLPFG